MYATTATTTLPLRIAKAAAKAGRGVLRVYSAFATRRRNRKALQDMLLWDDHLLHDIGLERGDVRWVLDTKRDFDPTRRLHSLAVERRSSDRDALREASLTVIEGGAEHSGIRTTAGRRRGTRAA